MSLEAPEVAQVDSVVEQTVEKRILGDLFGDVGRNRSDTGDVAVFAVLYVGPAPLCHLVANQHDELGARRAPLARAREHRGIGVGQHPLERLVATISLRPAIQAVGVGLGAVHDRGP